jgi:ComF family protein
MRRPGVLAALHGFGLGLLDLLLPARCAACGAPPEDRTALCPGCSANLPRLPIEGCSLCQTRLASRRASTAAAVPRRCVACEGRRSPLYACIAAVALDGEAERSIRRFKYPERGLRGLDPAPRAVVEQLAQEAARRVPGPPPDLVVPVPLHPRRLRERGFNQAALLAHGIGRSWGVPTAPRALRRVRETSSQTGLGRRARRGNVAGAFECRAGSALPERIWLVDDVVTTGSTLEEAARVLRRGGARHIAGVCAARALAIH